MTPDGDFTVLGASGFVGAALIAALRDAGRRVHPVTRAALPSLLRTGRSAGHVIDCIGVTGDFRTRALDTAEAHVSVTLDCLRSLRFQSFLFVSSTRVYARASSTHEAATLACMPTDPSDLYNLSKLAGEALCLTDVRPDVRVVRLSNVYGSGMGADNFLGQVLAEGRARRAVRFAQAPTSSKDYVSLADVVRLLPAIACRGRHRLYNLASGINMSHAEIAARLSEQFGWHIAFAADAPEVRFRPIETVRLTEEFGAPLSNLSADLSKLVTDGQEVQCSPLMSEAAG